MPDGQVELVAEGEPIDLDRITDAIRQTMNDHIQRIHTDSAVGSGEYDGFAIRCLTSVGHVRDIELRNLG
jgi:hypothetical protein